MMISGCHIVSKLCADNPDGFSSTVERGGFLKGPFATIQEAVACAHAWKDETPTIRSESVVPLVAQSVPPVVEQSPPEVTHIVNG